MSSRLKLRPRCLQRHRRVTFLWHDSEDLHGCDVIIVPGGFAYGDYLRTGAIARFSPVMQSVTKFAAAGGLVLGICNGFQILCDALRLARFFGNSPEFWLNLQQMHDLSKARWT